MKCLVFLFVLMQICDCDRSFQAQGCAEARVASSLGSQPLITTGQSELDNRVYRTIYEGFQIGKDIANTRGLLNALRVIF